MKFVPMKPLLETAARCGYAVPSFCIWNAESMETVLRVATRLKSPVILMCGPGEFPLLDVEVMGAVARTVASRYAVPAALHLDHGDSIEQVRRCLDAGFTSVMLDFSKKPFAENAAALQEVVDMARPRGVTVEGEIGAVGRVDDATTEGARVCQLTEPDEAKAYVAATGVDALAVAIGNAHGLYTKLPQLDFERLAAIRRQVGIPLVLHGGSGTPDDQLRQAIQLGMAKVNVASELVHTVRQSLTEQWSAGRNHWTPAALAEADGALAAVAERWIRRLESAGQA